MKHKTRFKILAISILPPRCLWQQDWQKRSKHKIETSKLTLAPNANPSSSTLTQMLTLNPNANCNANANWTLNLTPKGKVRKVLKKVKKKKAKSPKWELNRKAMAYQTWSITTTLRAAPWIGWQTDLFIRIVSCHEIECSTGGTIAPADLLPPECWW